MPCHMMAHKKLGRKRRKGKIIYISEKNNTSMRKFDERDQVRIFVTCYIVSYPIPLYPL